SVARSFEVHIPLPSRSAAAQHEFLLVTNEIGNWNCRLLRTRRWTLDVGPWVFFFFRRPNNRPHRNLYDFVRARAAAHFFSHPVPAVFRLDQGFIEKIGEIIDMSIGLKFYVNTVSTIAAVRATFRTKFIPLST